MAFHQTRMQAIQRTFQNPVEAEPNRYTQTAPSAIEESQTWVLFPPATEAGTTASYITETHHTESTPGRSQLSDLGSIHTVARSEDQVAQHRASFFSAVEGREHDDDAELDSLDSHLSEFRATPNLQQSSHGLLPIVPAHDGLGSFRLDRDGMGSDVQNRLYAFEQFNPRRVKRRRESLEQPQETFEPQEEQEMDKMRRIEVWRLEQSRCILDEIQKETRRRRRSAAGSTSTRPLLENSRSPKVSNAARISALDEVDAEVAWHEQQPIDSVEPESIWGCITRKVVRDFLGIDDELLSVLFGESLPDGDDLSSTPKALAPVDHISNDMAMTDTSDSSWQLKTLERIAKELGVFINHLSGHPGAFSTYQRMQQMTIPYAGLPSIPELANDDIQESRSRDPPPPSIPEFKPTIVPQPRPIAVPAPNLMDGSAPHLDKHATGSGDFTQEEWEQDLDVRLIFRYLRSRFISRSNGSGSVTSNTHANASNHQDAAAKAARVRQHHPLVAKARPAERRAHKAAVPSPPVLFRRPSSCASQSTRKSTRRSSCSSRHYWDIGAGSVGTGSMIAAAGPMGSWGEV